MNPIRQFIKKAISTVIPERLFMVRGTNKQTTSSAANAQPKVNIAFTFDDGPHPEHTPQLLDTLRQYHHQATFFVIGEKAQQYPELIERIINEGHEIGNHTFTHSEPAQTSARDFLSEIRKTELLLKQMTGFPPTLVRPPKGKLTIKKMLGLWIKRRTIVLWDTDPRDYSIKNTADIAEWCQSYVPSEGNFCLMHDNHPYAKDVVRLLSENQNYQIQSHTVSNWLAGKSNQKITTQQAYA